MPTRITTADLARLKPKDPSPIVSVIGTTALVLIALVVTSLLWKLADRPVTAPLFFAAIVLSTWLFGFRYGIALAMPLAAFLIEYFFVPPFYALSGSRDQIIRSLVLVVEGAVLAWLTSKLSLASEEISTSREELRELTKHQETLREAERKRIAREIHDVLGQEITGLKMKIHLMKQRMKLSDEVVGELEEIKEMADSMMSTVRRLSAELRPSLLDDFGLVAAMEWESGEFEKKSSIPCVFYSDTEALDLGAEANTAVYRIYQEAMTNVARHSDASLVVIELATAGGDIALTIRDNGKGIDFSGSRAKTTLGIIGMRERARLIGGELNVRPDPSGGTRVELVVPGAANELLPAQGGAR
ncbi:MAG: histidine kinase [Pyrinomonadaceae bacterium]